MFADAGLKSEAKRSFELAIATKHPDIAPKAAVNLGALYESEPDNIADAEAAYRLAMSSDHPEQAPIASVDLGNLLSRIPGRQLEAEAAYKEGMTSSNPAHAARAAYNLGCMLLSDPSRRRDTETAFHTDAESRDPGHAPLALYNLGRLVAEDPTRGFEARQLLEAASSTGNERVATFAAQALAELTRLQVSKKTVDPPEQPLNCVTAVPPGSPAVAAVSALRFVVLAAAPRSGSPWSLARVTWTSPQLVVEMVPEGQHFEICDEHFAARSILGAHALPPNMIEQTDSEIKRHLTNGESRVVLEHQRDDEIVYWWSVHGDDAVEDQFEVQRWSVSDEGLRNVRYLARAPLTEARPSAALGLVAAAQIDWQGLLALRSSEAVPTLIRPEESKQLVNTLHRSLPIIHIPAEQIWLEVMSKIRRDLQPQLWATVSSMIGMQLFGASDDMAGTKIAVRALSQALEVLAGDGETQLLWRHTMFVLGRAQIRLAMLGKSGAAHVAERILDQAERAFRKVGASVDMSRAASARALVRIVTNPAGRGSLTEAVELFNRAREHLTPRADPSDWVDALSLPKFHRERNLSRS